MRKLKFSEKFSITDLDNNAISDLTAKFLFDREHGSGHNRLELLDCQIRNDRLYLHYRTYPTYTTDTVRILPNGSEVPTKYYDTLFEFLDVEAELGDANTFNSFNSIEKIAILRDFLQHGMARVWCNCPAFYYQSHWEGMSELDSTIFPFPGPKGTGVWKNRHAPGLKQSGISICKHIAACIHFMLKRDIHKILKFILKSKAMNTVTESRKFYEITIKDITTILHNVQDPTQKKTQLLLYLTKNFGKDMNKWLKYFGVVKVNEETRDKIIIHIEKKIIPTIKNTRPELLLALRLFEKYIGSGPTQSEINAALAKDTRQVQGIEDIVNVSFPEEWWESRWNKRKQTLGALGLTLPV